MVHYTLPEASAEYFAAFFLYFSMNFTKNDLISHFFRYSIN